MNLFLRLRMARGGALLLIAVLVLAISLAGCTDGDSGETVTPEEPPVEELGALDPMETITIAEDGSPSGAGFYIATERGYFEELGLKAKYVTFQSSAYMLPALAAGQVDVAGGIMTTSFLNAVERGLDIKIVADKGRNIPGSSYFDIVVAKDKVDEIKTLGDLKGRRISITAYGSVDEMFVDIALTKAGLTKEDVEYIILESFGDHNTALANGAVDVSMHIEPLITAGEAKGILDRWIDATEWAPDFQVAVVLSSPEFIDGRSEVAKRFMVAYLRGLRDYYDAFINGVDTDEIVEIMTQYTNLKDKELWDQVNVVGLNPDGYVKVDSIEWQIGWFKSRDYYDGELTAEDLVDHSLVDFAINQLGKYEEK